MIPKKGFISLLCAGLISIISILPSATAFAKSNTATSAQSLPILSVTPNSGSNEVKPDSPIVIQLDSSSPNFTRFREQLIKGAFTVLVNGVEMMATYNPVTYSIVIQHPLLARYTNYTVQLLLKAAGRTGGPADNAEESFSFETGSAIGEATHASAELETPSTRVGTTANLKITATDDYGDAATNATVSLSGSGPGNAVNPSQFKAPVTTHITNGEADIRLQDTTAETVNLSYVVSDNTYGDTNDVHSGKLTETFVPGPTANVQVSGPETYVAGDSGATYRAVLADAYGNPVADGTGISVTSANGSITNQTGVVNGAFSFDYKPSTSSGNDTITLTATDSGYVSKTVVHVRPLPLVINSVENIDGANVSSFNVSGLGTPGNTVRIILCDGENQTAMATGIAGYDGRFVVNVDASSLKDGPVTIQATQTDVDGNVSDAASAATQKDMYIPTGVTVTGNTLSWKPVAGAAGYVVSVYDSEGHGNGTRTTDTSVNILDIPGIEAGVYKVDVRSYGVPSSPFGQSLSSTSVTMNIIGLSAPTNVQVNGTTVSWDAVQNATSYSVWVHDSNGNVAFATMTQGTSSVDLSHRGLPTGTYTVEINALDETEHYASSPWVTASVYVQSDGQLSTPSNVTVSGVKVSWDPVSGATGYEIKIYSSDKTGFESYNTNQTSTTIFQPTGNYFVSVTATAAPETNIANSPETKLIPVSVVALNSPVLTTSGSVVSWSPVSNATRYNVTVFDSTGNYVKSIGFTFVTSLDLSQQGLPTGDYILHVSAWDDTLTYAPSQDGISSIIHTVSRGELGTPTNVNALGAVVTWDAVQNATSYNVFVTDVQGTRTLTTSNTSISLSNLGFFAGKCSIQVVAIADDYTSSPPSMSVDIVLPGPPAPTNIHVNGTILTWDSVVNVSGYQVEIRDGTGTEVADIPCSGTSVDLARQGIPTGTYYAYIVGMPSSAGDFQSPPSQASAPVHVTSAGALATPLNLTLNGTILSWDAVPNATGYMVMENEDSQGFGINATSTSVDLAQLWIPDGTYNVTVIALGVGTSYSDSSPSSSVSFTLSS